MSLVDTAADVPLHGHDGLKGAAGMRALASRLAPRVLQLTAGPDPAGANRFLDYSCMDSEEGL